MSYTKPDSFAELYAQINSTPTSLLMTEAAELNSRGIASSDESVAGFLEFILTRDPKERPKIDQVIERLPFAPREDKDFEKEKDNSARGLDAFSFFLGLVLIL
jgi:hypothetical protein